MSAYDYVNASVLLAFLNLFHLFCAAQSANVIYTAREILEPAAESCEMLKRKYGGRNEDSHLLAVADSLESGSDSDFRLSEAHITADKTVHGAIVLHISLDSLCSKFLVRSILEHK